MDGIVGIRELNGRQSRMNEAKAIRYYIAKYLQCYKIGSHSAVNS